MSLSYSMIYLIDELRIFLAIFTITIWLSETFMSFKELFMCTLHLQIRLSERPVAQWKTRGILPTACPSLGWGWRYPDLTRVPPSSHPGPGQGVGVGVPWPDWVSSALAPALVLARGTLTLLWYLCAHPHPGLAGGRAWLGGDYPDLTWLEYPCPLRQ